MHGYIIKTKNSEQSITPTRTLKVVMGDKPNNWAKNSLRPIAPNNLLNKSSCDTNHLQDPPNQVMTKWLSLQFYLASSFSNILFFLIVIRSVNWAVNHKIKSPWPLQGLLKILWFLWQLPNTKRHQELWIYIFPSFCLSILISSHRNW